jgi:hypothetical protein
MPIPVSLTLNSICEFDMAKLVIIVAGLVGRT